LHHRRRLVVDALTKSSGYANILGDMDVERLSRIAQLGVMWGMLVRHRS